MSRTPSNMVPLGTKAPYFKLTDTVTEKAITLESAKGKNGTVIMFICNHCPFVIHVNSELIAIANKYDSKGIGFLAISSNDAIHYPQDGPEHMKVHAISEQYPFPYLYDESQDVAKSYDAACTPDIFVFDADLQLIYRGQLDDSRPGNGKSVTGNDLRNALDYLLANKENTMLQKPSIGCSIKWKNPS